MARRGQPDTWTNKEDCLMNQPYTRYPSAAVLLGTLD
jgi:hypothetical protein